MWLKCHGRRFINIAGRNFVQRMYLKGKYGCRCLSCLNIVMYNDFAANGQIYLRTIKNRSLLNSRTGWMNCWIKLVVVGRLVSGPVAYNLVSENLFAYGRWVVRWKIIFSWCCGPHIVFCGTEGDVYCNFVLWFYRAFLFFGDDFMVIICEMNDEIWQSVGRRICNSDFSSYSRGLVIFVIPAWGKREGEECDKNKVEKLDSLFHDEYTAARKGMLVEWVNFEPQSVRATCVCTRRPKLFRLPWKWFCL